MQQTINDDELLRRAVNRDAEAFAALYRKHAERVFRHVYYLVGTRHEAEDLTSETFLRVWKSIDRFEDRGLPIQSWFLRIAHNTAVKYLKKRRTSVSVSDIELEADGRRSPESVLETTFNAGAVRSAILELPEMQRQVIMWRFIDELSYDEIQALVGKSKGSIRVIQCRALQRLRTLLAQDLEAEPAKRKHFSLLPGRDRRQAVPVGQPS